MDLLIWAGKVSLCWLLFYGCFHFFLRKLTHFKWNRFYLLSGLILSLMLPFVKIPALATQPIGTYLILLEPVQIAAQAEPVTSLSWFQLALAVYCSIVFFMGFRLSSRLMALRQLWRKATQLDSEGKNSKIYLLPDDHIGSFSFLNKIAINPSDYANHFDQILSHEMIHVKQRHSLDILLVEVLNVLFWFHPILPFYKKSLEEIHEYLADENADQRDTYARFLVDYTLCRPTLGFVNNFYQSSLLKRRIQMLYKNKSSKWNLGFYGLSVIFTLSLLAAVSSCSDNTQKTEPEMVEVLNPPIIIADDDTEAQKAKVNVEDIPEFPGGKMEMYKFLGTNIRYPKEASAANITGKVYLQFIVKRDGSISDVSVAKGIGYGCDEEAMRVVKLMPKWTPGKDNGTIVDAWYQLPINYQLE